MAGWPNSQENMKEVTDCHFCGGDLFTLNEEESVAYYIIGRASRLYGDDTCVCTACFKAEVGKFYVFKDVSENCSECNCEMETEDVEGYIERIWHSSLTLTPTDKTWLANFCDPCTIKLFGK